MKGDFSRDTFDPTKHYSRVLMQQGRVQLDADWNEQAAIQTHYLRALVRDLVGDHAGPARDLGFTIDPDCTTDAGLPDLGIGEGHYYVGGILCEADPDHTYFIQPHYLPTEPLPSPPYLVYLDVWEHHITCLEDDHIREVALNGPDTATRTKVVWQVKVIDRCYPQGEEEDLLFDALGANEVRSRVEQFWVSWVEHWQPAHRGMMAAWTKKAGAERWRNPCNVPPDARYRGDNRLYRVEIHEGGGDGEATFKWSRDNGSVVAELTHVEGHDLVVRGIRDSERGFAPGQWVEVLDERMELRNEPGTMYKLGKVEGEILTVAERQIVGEEAKTLSETDTLSWEDTWQHPKVRRWDGAVQVIGKAIGQDADGADIRDLDFQLENGIEIQFSEAATYRTGDYWQIPARTATGDVEWPHDENKQAIPQNPHGVLHHYAPLAIVYEDDGGDTQIIELRRRFSLPVPYV
jgi:hypothetical protein